MGHTEQETLSSARSKPSGRTGPSCVGMWSRDTACPSRHKCREKEKVGGRRCCSEMAARFLTQQVLDFRLTTSLFLPPRTAARLNHAMLHSLMHHGGTLDSEKARRITQRAPVQQRLLNSTSPERDPCPQGIARMYILWCFSPKCGGDALPERLQRTCN